MRRSWFGRERAWLLAYFVAGVGLCGCGGKEFSSGQGAGASGGDSGAAGKSMGGSSSGRGGSNEPGGSGGASGSAGAGGTASGGCTCAPGQYCRDASKDCFDCAELSRLRFSTPQRLDTLSNSNQASHFPRVGETGTDLLYSVTGAGLRYTSDFSTSAGNALEQSTPQDSGPLLLPSSVSLSDEDFDFAFDRETATGQRQLFFGQWQGGLGAVFPAPAPYNGDANDFSIAIATAPTDDGIARAYWMTDREGDVGLTLITALLTANVAGGPVMLSVGQDGCAPEQADLSPWVAADGQTLLFSSARVDDNCLASDHKDLYTTLLQPSSGQPTAPAVPLADVNSEGNDVDPSFSRDLCELYFASDRDGDYALYRAHRR